MRILLVGPLPSPINGCSYANQVFTQRAQDNGESVISVNTSTPFISSGQGKFSWRKISAFFRCYLEIPSVLASDVLYITPGQTFFGVIKYAPYMVLASLARRPYVLHLHGNHLGFEYSTLTGIRRKMFHRLVSGASAGIVLSDSLKANFFGLLPQDRVFSVENFAGDALFAADISEKPRDALSIVWLSNLMREKGIFELIAALNQLKQRGIAFKARLAGNIEDSLGEDLSSKLSALAPEVEYVGPVAGDQKTTLLAESNVFVLPTYYAMEGQPIALLEAMATGNIIVTTSHAGIPDVVDESNGYLVPVRTVEALTDCFTQIADSLPLEMSRISTHNRETAKARFTEQEFTENVLKVLRLACRNARPRGIT